MLSAPGGCRLSSGGCDWSRARRVLRSAVLGSGRRLRSGGVSRGSFA